jgi:hypothetical protein
MQTLEDANISNAHGSADNIVKLYYQNQLYIQCKLHQNSNNILHMDIKINPEVHMEYKRSLVAKAILSKETNAGGIIIPNFKLY